MADIIDRQFLERIGRSEARQVEWDALYARCQALEGRIAMLDKAITIADERQRLYVEQRDIAQEDLDEANQACVDWILAEQARKTNA
jgi:hypothetical protein